MSRRQNTMLGSGIFKGSELGQTLTEVLVALAILAAVGVAFLAGMQTSSKSVIISQQSVTAENLAKSQIEDTKLQAYVVAATSYPTITIPPDLVAQGYSITVVAIPKQSPDKGEQRITVTVSQNGQTLFTLAGYKVQR
jgi:type II secretory pathway pseudopilin PulG